MQALGRLFERMLPDSVLETLRELQQHNTSIMRVGFMAGEADADGEGDDKTDKEGADGGIDHMLRIITASVHDQELLVVVVIVVSA